MRVVVYDDEGFIALDYDETSENVLAPSNDEKADVFRVLTVARNTVAAASEVAARGTKR